MGIVIRSKSTAPLESPEIHLMLDELAMYISPKVIILRKFINGSPTTSVYVGHMGTPQKLVSQPNGEPPPSVVDLIIIERASIFTISPQLMIRRV